MAKVLDKKRTHSSALPMERSGGDTFAVSTTNGDAYYGCRLTLLESDLHSGARVTAQPALGAKGDLSVTVGWWHGVADKVKYQLEAFTQPAGVAAKPVPPSRVTTGFIPSQHGFHFANSFPPVPDIVIPIPFGRIELGDASNGLCGGMVFAALDHYLAKHPIVAQKNPPTEGAVFEFIVRRLLNSFNLPLGVMNYIVMMSPDFPDGETRNGGLFAQHGRAWQTIRVEWPLIKEMLDAGQPCPLGLIRIKSKDLSKLGINHQVLATGYDVDGDTLSLFIYDPNFPDRDDLKLTLNLSAPEQPTPINYSANDGLPVLAFFRVNYKFRTPPAV